MATFFNGFTHYRYNLFTDFAFFGLIVASILVVSKRIVKWGPVDVAALLLTSILGYFIVGAVPVETPATLLAFFLSGAVAICAMILPGVSGSFLLIILGKYEQILMAVNQRDFFALGAVAMGAAVGLAIFSRVLSWLFSKHHDLTIAALTGFMIGSLRKIWPWKGSGEINSLPEVYDSTVVFALILAFIGAGIIFYLNKLHVTDTHTKDV